MCEAKRIVYLVGAGMGTPGGMTQEAKEALENRQWSLTDIW